MSEKIGCPVKPRKGYAIVKWGPNVIIRKGWLYEMDGRWYPTTCEGETFTDAHVGRNNPYARPIKPAKGIKAKEEV